MNRLLNTVLLRLVQHNEELLEVQKISIMILWFVDSVVGKRTSSAAWMQRRKLSKVPDLAINDYPAVIGLVVHSNLLRREESGLGHIRYRNYFHLCLSVDTSKLKRKRKHRSTVKKNR